MAKQRVHDSIRGDTKESKESAPAKNQPKPLNLAFYLSAACGEIEGASTGTHSPGEKYRRMTDRELADELTSKAAAAGMWMRKQNDADSMVPPSAIAVLLGSAGMAGNVVAGAIPVSLIAGGAAVIIGGGLFAKSVLERARAAEALEKTLGSCRPAAYEMLKRKGIAEPAYDVTFVREKGISSVDIRAYEVEDDGTKTLAHFAVRGDGEIVELLGRDGSRSKRRE